MKKRFIRILIVIVGLLIVIPILFVVTGLVDRVVERVIEKRIYRVDNSVLTDPGIHVMMAGTGTPNYDPIRNPTCVALVAGGEFMLFDVGDGCTTTLDSMDMPINEIKTVFFTHFHSDHINGLGHLIAFTWVQGRKEPIHVYGPPGVENVVNGFALAAKEDILIRANPRALAPLDAKLAVGIHHEFRYPEDGTPVIVWQKNGVVVKAFKNDHYDVEVSCGYRIEYKNRVIVVSGDTVKSDFVIQNARNADILIHEAFNPDMVQTAIKIFRNTGTPDGIWKADHISKVIKHHVNTLEVAQVAKAAGVGKLVLYHVGPGIPDNWIIKRQYKKGMSDIYQGPIVISKDKDRFYLEPGQD